MIQKETKLIISDNSGGRIIKCISLRNSYKTVSAGFIIKGAIQRLRNKRRSKSRVKLGKLYSVLVIQVNRVGCSLVRACHRGPRSSRRSSRWVAWNSTCWSRRAAGSPNSRRHSVASKTGGSSGEEFERRRRTALTGTHGWRIWRDSNPRPLGSKPRDRKSVV